MAKRTIRDARSTLDDLRPTLNDHWLKQYEAEIAAASAKAVAGASAYADSRMQDAEGERQRVLADLCELRDGFDALTAHGETGRLAARDYAEAFATLQQSQRRLKSRLTELDSFAETLEAIEDDPEGWFDDTFHEKYAHIPQMLPDFTF